ncbi:MAG: hypothetical protein ACI9DM_000255 [Cyclobacteriaceae bacterium]|jgi:hypothetical protein
MTLDLILESVNERLNKDQNGRTTKPARFNHALRVSNTKLFNIKAGLPQDFAPGQPIPRQALDVSFQIPEALRFCLKRLGGQSQGAPVVDGYVSLPDDFIKLGGLRHSYNKSGERFTKPIAMAFEGEWGIILSSSIRKPTLRKARARLAAGGKAFEILPKEIKRVDLPYYRLPVTPFYDFIIDSNDQQKYLPPGSVHNGTGELPTGTLSRSKELEWPENVHPEMIDMVYHEIAMSIRDQFASQDAQNRKDTGK